MSINMNEILERLKALEADKVLKQERIEYLENQIVFLRQIQEYSLGTGAEAIKMSRKGLWLGANSYEDAVAGTKPASTAFGINGDVALKGGATGTFTESGGHTLTIVKGYITNIT